MLKNSFFVVLPFLMLSCNSLNEDLAGSQSFIAPKEQVWKVLVAVFKSYPLKTIDEGRGYIETKELKGRQFWKAPHQKQEDWTGHSSVLVVRLSYNKPVARVYIDKKVYKQKGFISQKTEVPSDFLEERVLIYRIARELSLLSQIEGY